MNMDGDVICQKQQPSEVSDVFAVGWGACIIQCETETATNLPFVAKADEFLCHF